MALIKQVVLKQGVSKLVIQLPVVVETILFPHYIVSLSSLTAVPVGLRPSASFTLLITKFSIETYV